MTTFTDEEMDIIWRAAQKITRERDVFKHTLESIANDYHKDAHSILARKALDEAQ